MPLARYYEVATSRHTLYACRYVSTLFRLLLRHAVAIMFAALRRYYFDVAIDCRLRCIAA